MIVFSDQVLSGEARYGQISFGMHVQKDKGKEGRMDNVSRQAEGCARGAKKVLPWADCWARAAEFYAGRGAL